MRAPLLYALFATLFLYCSHAAFASLYDFKTRSVSFKTKDGTTIALTFYQPRAKFPGETFPAILSMNPYRKDDLFRARDYGLHAYFAERGFLSVRADLRGTGSSSGPLPDQEYSNAEISDAEQLITWLARRPEANGSVGMWGLSWGAFNAVQTAMRRPKHLKAILILHASDDLYRDDVHYVDGVFHMDEYMLDMNHEVALPAPPDYTIDANYIRERFASYPWIFTYLKQQRDGPFWRKKSLRWQYEKIKVPMYVVGGLLDTYRDSVPRILENVKVPLRAVMGPWIHTWPDTGFPAPAFEWRVEAVDFWNRWLREKAKPKTEEPKFLLFMRERSEPSTQAKSVPGVWCELGRNYSKNLRLHTSDQGLHFADIDLATKRGARDLVYHPGEGEKFGFYWGELTGPQPANEGVAFDSEVLSKDITIAGIPSVRLRAKTDAPLVHWVTVLEDVSPDGVSALVTGANLNGSQRFNRLQPQPHTVRWEQFRTNLHFTTWTFRKGHRIRLRVSHAAFPMLWPTPNLAKSKIDTSKSSLTLPEFTGNLSLCSGAAGSTAIPRPPYPGDEFMEESSTWPENLRSSRTNGVLRVEADARANWKLGPWKATLSEHVVHSVNEKKSAQASYEGTLQHLFVRDERKFQLRTQIKIQSDHSHFHVNVTRELETFDGQPPNVRKWTERLRRDFQ